MSRWKNSSPEERSKAMSDLVKIRHAKMSKEEKRNMGIALANTRWKKLSTGMTLLNNLDEVK